MEMDDEAVEPRAELESARTTGPALCSNRRCRTSVRQPLLRRRREATCLSDGDKVLRYLAEETGGQAYFPRFTGELPGIFRQIAQSLRTQYSLGYSPNNQLKDGKYRKITVQLVKPGTAEPLRMLNEKGKPMKYTILAKAGYTAPRAVE